MLNFLFNGNIRRSIEDQLLEAERHLLVAEAEVEMREHLVREARSSATAFRDRITRLQIHRTTMMTDDEIQARMESAAGVLQ